MVCECGATMRDGARFCPSCGRTHGAPAAAPVIPAPTAPTPEAPASPTAPADPFGAGWTGEPRWQDDRPATAAPPVAPVDDRTHVVPTPVGPVAPVDGPASNVAGPPPTVSVPVAHPDSSLPPLRPSGSSRPGSAGGGRSPVLLVVGAVLAVGLVGAIIAGLSGGSDDSDSTSTYDTDGYSPPTDAPYDTYDTSDTSFSTSPVDTAPTAVGDPTFGSVGYDGTTPDARGWVAVIRSEFPGQITIEQLQQAVAPFAGGFVITTDDYVSGGGQPPEFYPRAGVLAGVVGMFSSGAEVDAWCASNRPSGGCLARQLLPR